MHQIKDKAEGLSLDEISPFDGGYILNGDGEDLLFPQCCGDLGDVSSWVNLSLGHPCPNIEIRGNSILLNLIVGESGEHFVPQPLKEKFKIDRIAKKSSR